MSYEKDLYAKGIEAEEGEPYPWSDDPRWLDPRGYREGYLPGSEEHRRFRVKCKHWIYFVQLALPDGSPGPVKVGHTQKLDCRLSNIQSCNPYDVRVLGVVHGEHEDEEAWKAAFREHWMRGEWFRPSREVLDDIARVTEPYGWVAGRNKPHKRRKVKQYHDVCRLFRRD